MKRAATLPRILVIDDVYGRDVEDGNEDRIAFCLQFRLQDVTPGARGVLRIPDATAEAVFCRGQSPSLATRGDVVANDLPGTMQVLEEGWHNRPPGTPPWALVLLDLRFRCGHVTAGSESTFGPGIPEGLPHEDPSTTFFGMRILEEVQKKHPHLPVVVLSEASRESTSREWTSLGAVAFLGKGDIHAADKLRDYLRRHALVPDPTGEIVGTSIPLLIALRNARRAALGHESILIRGETGTGKELLARYIHRNDPRRCNGPLVIVDCGTLSPELYASELFGHARGAFTGAVNERTSRIVEADHGILFLDEIGNVDLTVQRGLLRVLQEKIVNPVGGSRARNVDVRFIFATNEDIESRAAAEDGFRFDLLERVRQSGTIVLPPLRERTEDLPDLVEALVRRAEAETDGAVHRKIDPAVFDRLERSAWRGNIRQLRTCIRKAVSARPDVEYLVPVHLEVPDRDTMTSNAAAGVEPRPSERTSLATAIAALRDLSLDGIAPHELSGKFRQLEAAYAAAAMRYLRACLDLSKKRTTRNPAGEILVQPAVRLMLGDSNITASQAYDFVIRLRNFSASAAPDWEADDVLHGLFEHARAQRRSGRSLRRRAGDEGAA